MILFLILFKSAFSFSADKICRIDEQVCTGSYDLRYNYRLVCENAKCGDNFPFQCGQHKCTVNESTCSAYFNMYKFLKKIEGTLIVKETYHAVSLVNKRINECPKLKYTFNADDFCTNGENCVEKIRFFKRRGMSEFIKKIECPCMGVHSFHCGKGLCVKNQKVCQYHEMIKTINATFNFTNCGNSNLIIQKAKILPF